MPEFDLAAHLASCASRKQWEKIGTRKRSGILVPLFSIYSRHSQGIGDFSDLKTLIDWAKLTGNSIIQLLPLNELGGFNCPYDSVSSFALEPSFIDLKSFPGFKNDSALFSCAAEFIDYAVKPEKLRRLWKIFLPLDLSDAEDFERFQAENAYWLTDFALFKALKNFHQGQAWYDWPEPFKNRQMKALEDFRHDHIEEITFQMWLQWIAYQQLAGAKVYAARQGVYLKGDLPILVSRDSADVWAHTTFFKLDFASGAPPDMYCAKGQRWGMPTYHWENIAADGYRYIKEKLKYAQNFYDLLRLDHVVGLFRIWSIPDHDALENRGLHGFFDPSDEKVWSEHGRRILDCFLKNTSMLLCAEDLGVIPAACPQALLEFGIPGNDVQRWVKDWSRRHDFLSSQEYRAVSVAMLSTHDTTNWKAWWQYEAGTVDEALFMRKCSGRVDFAKVKEKLFDLSLSRHGRLRWLNSIDSAEKLILELAAFSSVPREHLADFVELYLNSFQEKEKLWNLLECPGQMEEAASPALLRRMIKFTLDSSAIVCIQSVWDWLGLADILKGDPYDSRVNVPGTVNLRNWSLRLPIPLEDLITHPVNQEIHKLIVDSTRV